MRRSLVAAMSAASVILLVLAASPVDGGVIAYYTFPASGNFSSSDAEPHSTASDVVGGGCNVFGINTWSSPVNSSPVLQIDHTNPYGTGEAWAFLYGVYSQFTVTAGTSYELNLDNLTFDAMKASSGGSRMWYLYSSVDGFIMGDATRIDCSVITYYLGDSHGGAMEPFTVDLSASKFDHLSSIMFDVYYSEGGYGASFFDNVKLNGTVKLIPEPGTLALVGTGAIGGLGCIRRRRTR